MDVNKNGGGLDLNRVCVIDVESTDLLANMLTYKEFPYRLREDAKLWCVVVTNVLTKEYDIATKENITKEWLEEVLSKYDVIVAHNGNKFDLRTLSLFEVLDYHIGYLDESDKVFGRDVWIIDTLIWSRLFNPDRYGGHSLSAWGLRLQNKKDDFRQKCIEAGIISKDAPKGAEFKIFSDIMCNYCIQDTMVNVDLFLELLAEYQSYKGWAQASKMEHKLADLALNRETLGFKFDKPFAIKCVEDLTEKINAIADKINPILPLKRMTKGEISSFTPPINQITKKGELTAHMRNFIARVGGKIDKVGEDFYLSYKKQAIKIPFDYPLEQYAEATIENFDHVKMFLMDSGWEATEWRIRDLTKDSKKQKITLEQSIKALDKWYVETMEGKYTKGRMKELGYKEGEHEKMYHNLRGALEEGKFSVIIPTSPSVRVGVEKELCPNLVALGDKVWFAQDFALFLTYRHRRSSIAGGDIEDMDFDVDYPNSGFLSMYREEDGRIPTPAIEIGCNTSRMRHIGVVNVSRVSSIYGAEMRSLFGSGDIGLQFGYDFSSLEARVQGHYCWKYTDGQKLAEQLLAEKPNDIHSVRALDIGIKRDEAKSVNYMLLYGGKIPKVMKMLACDKSRATEVFNGFWNGSPSLKELKDNLEKFWANTDNKYVLGIDGRQILTRSKHSLLNALFQSAGVILAKYINVRMHQKLESQGYNMNCFKGVPDVGEMISMHDEVQFLTKRELFNFKTFNTEEEAKIFVKNWEGEQLSSINHGSKWFVVLPNPVSIAVGESIKEMEKMFKLNVELGYEWTVGRNWKECH